MVRGAIYQKDWAQVDDLKPAGLCTNAPHLAQHELFHQGWPEFDAEGYYSGPLPRRPVEGPGLIGKASDGTFNTKPTAAYPPGMCTK